MIHGKVPAVKPAPKRKNNPEKRLPREVQERIERLVLLREKIYGFKTQKGFTDFITAQWGFSMSPARWNVYETGGNLTQPIENLLVRHTPGLTVDWLRSGERRGLSVDLDRRLYGTPQGDHLS